MLGIKLTNSGAVVRTTLGTSNAQIAFVRFSLFPRLIKAASPKLKDPGQPGRRPGRPEATWPTSLSSDGQVKAGHQLSPQGPGLSWRPQKRAHLERRARDPQRGLS